MGVGEGFGYLDGKNVPPLPAPLSRALLCAELCASFGFLWVFFFGGGFLVEGIFIIIFLKRKKKKKGRKY